MTALKPRDVADLEQLLRESSGSLEVVGGRSRRAVGRPLDVALLDVSALAGVIDYQPAELVLSAYAGTRLADIEPLLARQGQRLAFEPPDPGLLLGASGGGATLGGTLMANVSGPRRVTAGSARDHFLGFDAVSGAGERFRGGGKVVKNVTGFDLPRLLAGSWGTLAVLVAATVRVVPTAETECTLLLPAPTVERAVAVCAAALGSACDVSAAALLPAVGLGLRLEGFEQSVSARLQRLRELLRPGETTVLEHEASQTFWRRAGTVADLGHFPVVWRVQVPPVDAPRVIKAVAPEDFVLDWGGALLWLAGRELPAARVRAALRGGHATLFKAPGELRAAGAVFQPQEPVVARLQTRLKAAFDPQGRLNPGRLD